RGCGGLSPAPAHRCAALYRHRLHAARLHHRHPRRARQRLGRAPRRAAGRRVGGALGLPRRALLQERHFLRPPHPRAAGAPAGPDGTARMRAQALAGLGRREAVALALLAAALLAAPLVVNGYILSVLVLALFAAYFGTAWNLLTGFAGQLSLGHALYVGLGAYASAALFVRLGLPPWLGMIAGMAIAALAGSVIGALSFRFGVTGVYFALLTIAFNEFTRILFDHFGWVGATSGLFLPVTNRAQDNLWTLRGSPVMFYYLLLVLTSAALLLCHRLLNRRIGYYWQAIREDQEAAQALGINVFRTKLWAM